MKRVISLRLPINMYTILKQQADARKETVQAMIYRILSGISGYNSEIEFRTKRNLAEEFGEFPWYGRLLQLRLRAGLAKEKIGAISSAETNELIVLQRILRKELNKQYQKKHRKKEKKC